MSWIFAHSSERAKPSWHTPFLTPPLSNFWFFSKILSHSPGREGIIVSPRALLAAIWQSHNVWYPLQETRTEGGRPGHKVGRPDAFLPPASTILKQFLPTWSSKRAFRDHDCLFPRLLYKYPMLIRGWRLGRSAISRGFQNQSPCYFGSAIASSLHRAIQSSDCHFFR